jgi:hypothetical protein
MSEQLRLIEAMRLCIACSAVVISCHQPDENRYVGDEVRPAGCADIASVSDLWLAGMRGRNWPGTKT